MIEPEMPEHLACAERLLLYHAPWSSNADKTTCVGWSTLPASVTPGLVKMIGRKHLRDPHEKADLLSFPGVPFKQANSSEKYMIYVTPMTAGRNIFLLTEKFIRVFRDEQLSSHSILILLKDLG